MAKLQARIRHADASGVIQRDFLQLVRRIRRMAPVFRHRPHPGGFRLAGRYHRRGIGRIFAVPLRSIRGF